MIGFLVNCFFCTPKLEVEDVMLAAPVSYADVIRMIPKEDRWSDLPAIKEESGINKPCKNLLIPTCCTSGQRLVFIPFDYEPFKRYLAFIYLTIMCNINNAQYDNEGQVPTYAEALERFEERVEERHSLYKSYIVFLVTEKTYKVVGYVSFYPGDTTDIISFAIFLRQDVQQRGNGQFLIISMIHTAYEWKKKGLIQASIFQALCVAKNKKMRKCLEAIGFIFDSEVIARGNAKSCRYNVALTKEKVSEIIKNFQERQERFPGNNFSKNIIFSEEAPKGGGK